MNSMRGIGSFRLSGSGENDNIRLLKSPDGVQKLMTYKDLKLEEVSKLAITALKNLNPAERKSIIKQLNDKVNESPKVKSALTFSAVKKKFNEFNQERRTSNTINNINKLEQMNKKMEQDVLLEEAQNEISGLEQKLRMPQEREKSLVELEKIREGLEKSFPQSKRKSYLEVKGRLDEEILVVREWIARDEKILGQCSQEDRALIKALGNAYVNITERLEKDKSVETRNGVFEDLTKIRKHLKKNIVDKSTESYQELQNFLETKIQDLSAEIARGVADRHIQSKKKGSN